MSELRELVWSKTGLVIEKDKFFEEEYEELFFDKLDESVCGIEKRTVWFHKYNNERFFGTEEEALEDCQDYSEIEVDDMALGKRLKELDEEGKE